MRRAFVEQALAVGTIRLNVEQSHHMRNVLRMSAGDRLELFNDQRQSATAEIEVADSAHVIVRVLEVREQAIERPITIAAAVPKGDRADWMIEKLSEIGVCRFIPLATERSVVLPSGVAKFERWRRIATEAAKQSRRAGTMQIDLLTNLPDCLNENLTGIYLAIDAQARPLGEVLSQHADRIPPLLIGPEGGWSNSEIVDFHARSLTGARLTATILRTETAAVAAAVIAAAGL